MEAALMVISRWDSRFCTSQNRDSLHKMSSGRVTNSSSLNELCYGRNFVAVVLFCGILLLEIHILFSQLYFNAIGLNALDKIVKLVIKQLNSNFVIRFYIRFYWKNLFSQKFFSLILFFYELKLTKINFQLGVHRIYTQNIYMRNFFQF